MLLHVHKLLVIVFISALCGISKASVAKTGAFFGLPKHEKHGLHIQQKAQQFILRHNDNPNKLVALGLTVTLGVFGVHRLYLGTEPYVPVVYTITLGGGIGILPATDFIAILLESDLSKFNNGSIVMWL